MSGDIFEAVKKPNDLKPMTWALSIKEFKDSFIDVVSVKGQRNRYNLIHDKEIYRNIDGTIKESKDIDCFDLKKKEVIEMATAMRENQYAPKDEPVDPNWKPYNIFVEKDKNGDVVGGDDDEPKKKRRGRPKKETSLF